MNNTYQTDKILHTNHDRRKQAHEGKAEGACCTYHEPNFMQDSLHFWENTREHEGIVCRGYFEVLRTFKGSQTG